MLNLDFASAEDILMRRRTLRRELSGVEGLRELRIAVLSGSTTDQIVNTLDLLLLAAGFRATFLSTEYGRYYDDPVHDPQALIDFKPDLIYVHTSCRNTRNHPPLSATEADLPTYVQAELGRWQEIWDALEQKLNCQVIQNNFEPPANALLGNMDASSPGGESRFLTELNLAFAKAAAGRPRLVIQDVAGIAATVGLRNWFDWDRFFSYKLLLTPEANLALARSLASMIRAIYGKSRKVLVLDLDNTLWGGVIGDDGPDKILIGRETPQAEAYTAFQEYALALRNRGILLAVCSKNNEETAKSGFAHPDSVLKLEHFSAFKANWNPKHENILEIAAELNLGVDSFVFVDDNPAERAIVESQIPGIAVPDVGDEVTRYAAIIQQARYFEPASLSKEDLARAALYAENSQRTAQAAKFANYGEYLDSLEMTAEIDVFKPVYLERIAQLTNKTNQFNLTTRRYTLAEMEQIAGSKTHVALYGKLTDRFGDNGLISIVVGEAAGEAAAETLKLDLWLMSCRVLKRDMELAMLDEVVVRAQAMGLKTLTGVYLPTAKNSMVQDFYPRLGFTLLDTRPDVQTTWTLPLTSYTKQNAHIQVLEFTNA